MGKKAFEDAFSKDMAAHLNVTKDRILILGLTKGSIKVEFAVQPDTSGKVFETAALEGKLKKGSTVSFATLAADPKVLAADPSIKDVKTVKLEAAITATVSEGPCKEGGSNTCGADATCTDNKDMFECACKSGFTGTTTTGLKPTCTQEGVKLAGAFSTSASAVLLLVSSLMLW